MTGTSIKRIQSKQRSIAQPEVPALKQTESVIYHKTPTSNSKMKQPSVSTKKSKRNAVEDPEMMFDEWFNQWREMSPKYITVDLSLHTSLIGKPNKFLMLSQRPIKADSKCNSVLMHYKYIPFMLEEMQKLYTNLCKENGFIKPIEEEDGNLDSPESKF